MAKDTNTKRAGGRPQKYNKEQVRINLKVPVEVKEYLTIAAAKASIDQRRNISLTEYLCALVYTDMERSKGDLWLLK